MFAMEKRISDYEILLQTPRPERPGPSPPPTAEQLDESSSNPNPNSNPPDQARSPEKWITVRKRGPKSRSAGLHIPVHVSNRYSPLANPNPNPNPTLIIGSSIVRNVDTKTPATIIKCIPGARTGDIENHLRLLAKTKRKYSKIIIHAGGNDTRRRQSEVTKVGVESLCSLAKTMADSVVFSGPLPDQTSDDMYSRMSSFRDWLTKWCPENEVGFADHWPTFWRRAGLIRRDGIHPTLEGAALISKKLASFITNTNL